MGDNREITNFTALNSHRCVRMTRGGKIKTGADGKANLVIKITIIALLGLTIIGFLTFDYKDTNIFTAILDTFVNAGIMFGTPRLSHVSFSGAMEQLLVTFALATLATIFGAVIAFFASLLCAKNIANPIVANVVKSFVAFVRAVPTILWVFIIAMSSGLGSIAAVVGLTFHSAGYLTKAYAESIEEMNEGAIEALKTSGASFWQIVLQAIMPSSIRYMVAWTFLRFEINFANALAVGAAAGAGGIGFELWMAGNQYHDLRELGFLTYIIVIAAVLLEVIATKVKEKAG
ncbi:MAG: ABC transporter permease subunit [Dehalococcoidia bacterium]|nr:ABC transporter permease subunit [Dehalococcoidia bacterium]